MSLCILLRGDVHFNQWIESMGEEILEHRGTMSLLGVSAHPSDGQQLVRITAEDVAALACISASSIQAVSKEAPGVHKLERLRLIRGMKQHPLFQNLSYSDLYRFSYYFYKTQLEQGDVLSREGTNVSYLFYIDQGSVERVEGEKKGWKGSQRLLRSGSFPCLSSLMMNRPCDATYSVSEDHTVVYVCDPAVLQYFTDSRFLGMESLLTQLRDPSTDAAQALLKETVDGLRFYKVGDSVDRMHEGFQEVKNQKESALVVDDVLETRIHSFVSLLQRVYLEEEDEKKEHKEGVEYVASVGVELLQSMRIGSILSWILGFNTSENQPTLDTVTDGSADVEVNTENVNASPISSDNTSPLTNHSNATQPIDEEQIDQAFSHFLHRNNLNDYTDEQLLTVLMAFRYASPSDSAAYLLFVLLAGITEPCMITRDEFEKRAKLAGILTNDNQNQLMEYFFHSKNTIDFDEYWKLLHSSIIPSSIQSYLTNLTTLITQIIPDQHTFSSYQRQILQSYRKADHEAVLRMHSPFQLLSLPFPVPYAMTFAMRQESFSANYWYYVIGGFMGELFVTVIMDYQK